MKRTDNGTTEVASEQAPCRLARLLRPLQAGVVGRDTLAVLKPLDRMLKDVFGFPGLDFVGFVLALRNPRAAGLFAVGFRIVALALIPF